MFCAAWIGFGDVLERRLADQELFFQLRNGAVSYRLKHVLSLVSARRAAKHFEITALL